MFTSTVGIIMLWSYNIKCSVIGSTVSQLVLFMRPAQSPRGDRLQIKVKIVSDNLYTVGSKPFSLRTFDMCFLLWLLVYSSGTSASSAPLNDTCEWILLYIVYTRECDDRWSKTYVRACVCVHAFDACWSRLLTFTCARIRRPTMVCFFVSSVSVRVVLVPSYVLCVLLAYSPNRHIWLSHYYEQGKSYLRNCQ